MKIHLLLDLFLITLLELSSCGVVIWSVSASLNVGQFQYENDETGFSKTGSLRKERRVLDDHVDSDTPTISPSNSPQTPRPSMHPTVSPSSARPSRTPSNRPTSSRPSRAPSRSPSSSKPSFSPSRNPRTSTPSFSPSKAPSTSVPSRQPTSSPTTSKPSHVPSFSPTFSKPSHSPSSSQPSSHPTFKPSTGPSSSPGTSKPSHSPSKNPTFSKPSFVPSNSPITSNPTMSPSNHPTISSPSASPSHSPTIDPSKYRPNVLLIIMDDLKPMAESFRTPLIPRNSTRNTDRLVNAGIAFMNAHTQMSLCGPSRASFLTSLRPDALRIYNINVPNALAVRVGRSRHNKEILTLPRLFKLAGYNTYGIGKVFHENEFILMQDPKTWTAPVYTWVPKIKLGKVFPSPYPGSWIASPDVDDNFYSDGQAAILAAQLISDVLSRDRNVSNIPWFLVVGLWKPHLPWHAPKKYFEKCGDYRNYHGAYNMGYTANLDGANFKIAKGDGCGEVGEYKNGPTSKLGPGYATPDAMRQANHAYHATVLYNDAQMGIILDALDASSSKEDTIIVFMGDHGFHLGDKGLYCKHTNFEAATLTPMVIVPAINDPIKYRRGGKSYAPVELLDLMPTLYELARLQRFVNVDDYRNWHGESLIPILKDTENGFVKQMAVSQYYRGKGSGHVWGYSVRTTRYRYTNWDSKFEELYDYVTNRYETVSYQINKQLRSAMYDNAFYNKVFTLGRQKEPWDFDQRFAMRDMPPSDKA